MERFIGTAPKTTPQTNKLVSHGDDDDGVCPIEQTKIFVNSVYWIINPRKQSTKVTESVAYCHMFCCFKRANVRGNCVRNCDQLLTLPAQFPQNITNLNSLKSSLIDI